MTGPAELADLPFVPGEDPFVVEHGGFYRRWLGMIDDLGELHTAVAGLTGTTDDVWVPVWEELGRSHEAAGDRHQAAGDAGAARRSFLQAKTYYAIGRFPDAITPAKADVSRACVRAYLKACAHLDPPLRQVSVECDGRSIAAHYRVPRRRPGAGPAAAVLIMCGADVFKEDRGWAAEHALESGLASLVMDAPGTGENPFPNEPESVKAWAAAVDWLASQPEVDADRIGAFGISRGGYSVLLLAGSYPERVGAAVAIAGNHFGYRMSPDEARAFVEMRNRRSTYVFGAPGDEPTFPPTSVELEEQLFDRWALSELGLVDRIVCPLLLINGKHDHLAPIGNIYYLLEHGPVTGKEARVYADDGHCAFKHRREWGPEAFAWMARKLSAPD